MTRTRILGLAAALALALLVGGLAGARAAAQPAPGAGAGGPKPLPAAPPAVPAVCGQMNTVPSPNPGYFNDLRGVAALASNDVWAVGKYNTSSIDQTLVEHWNGTAWSLVPSPNGSSSTDLSGVAARASNDVWAVGTYNNGSGLDQTLVEHWNGSAWSVIASPNVGSGVNRLLGVAALPGGDAWAVGHYYNGSALQTLVEHWNGSTWAAVASPNVGTGFNDLTGVAALASNDVWAVGFYFSNSIEQTLVEHWNGSAWSVVPSPNPGGNSGNRLYGVAAAASNDVWAAGDTGILNSAQTIVEHWNGNAWSVVPSPNPGSGNNGLFGVAAAASNDAWAVGYYLNGSASQTLVEHWNGSAWSVVPSANVGSASNVLLGVSAPAGGVWAVGIYGNSDQTLVEQYGGPCGAPTATPTAPPAGTPTPTATPSSCPSRFSDVHLADYFYTPVLYLACHGVISGYADGTFRPYNNTTRSQMVKIVVLGFAKPLTTPGGGNYTFQDVPPSFPFFAVIETAAADSIVSGYGCGGPGEPCLPPQNRPYFRPYADVTRGQLSKIDVAAAGWPLHIPPAPTFLDVRPGSPFYPFVETAVCHGVISGYGDQTFRPFATATRGQISKIVYLSVTGTATCG